MPWIRRRVDIDPFFKVVLVLLLVALAWIVFENRIKLAGAFRSVFTGDQ